MNGGQQHEEYKMVRVVWIDSNCWHGQVEKQTFNHERMMTVGALVDEGIENIAIAQDVVFSKEVEFRNVIAIPRCCIQHMDYLKTENEDEKLKGMITEAGNRVSGITNNPAMHIKNDTGIGVKE